MHYLDFERVDCVPPHSTVSVHDNPEPTAQDPPSWLPHGWILEIKTRKSGKKVGSKYKCYLDPVSGSRFYSKTDVLRYIEGGKTSREETNFSSDSPDKFMTQNESSPDWLPSGWIKEVKYRRNSSGLKKDLYYKDPASGYVFRSRKDVSRYLETGEVGKHAFKENAKSITSLTFKEEFLPSSAAHSPQHAGAALRQCTFVSHTLSSNGIVGSSLSSVTAPNTNIWRESDIQVEAPDRFQMDRGCEPGVFSKRPSGVAQEVITGREGAGNLSSGPLSNKADVDLAEWETKRSPELVQGELCDPETSVEANPTITLTPTRKLTKQLAVTRSLRTIAADGNIPLQENETLLKHSQIKTLEPVNRSSVELLSDKSDDLAKHDMMDNKNEKSKRNELPCDQVDQNHSKTPMVNKLSEEKCFLHMQVEESHSEMTSKTSGELNTNIAKDRKESSFPRRASKRLAGLDPGPTVDIGINFRSCRKSKRADLLRDDPSGAVALKNRDKFESRHEAALDSCRRTKGKEPIVLDQYPEVVQHDDENKERSFASPFGDTWPDPCIEFAFRTLTGDIPGFEDSAMIDVYLQQQMSKTMNLSDTPNLLDNTSESVKSDSRNRAANVKIPVEETEALLESSLNKPLEPVSINSASRPINKSSEVAKPDRSDVNESKGLSCKKVNQKHSKTSANEKFEAEGLSCVQVNERDSKMMNKPPGKMSIIHATRSSSGGSTKGKDKKESSLAHRASKRLAGVEPTPTADIDTIYRSLRKKKRSTVVGDGSSDGVAFENPDNYETSREAALDSCRKTENKEPIVLDLDPQKEQSGTLQDANEKKESSFASPFGDTWPDPCIEFAFKTLIGEIPVIEDSATIEDYLKKQMSKTMSPSNSSVQLDDMSGLNTSPVKADQECPLTNGIQSGGDMNRRSLTVKVNN